MEKPVENFSKGAEMSRNVRHGERWVGKPPTTPGRARGCGDGGPFCVRIAPPTDPEDEEDTVSEAPIPMAELPPLGGGK